MALFALSGDPEAESGHAPFAYSHDDVSNPAAAEGSQTIPPPAKASCLPTHMLNARILPPLKFTSMV